MTVDPLYQPLLDTAEAVALARPEVDLDLARQVFQEAATLLHDGLVLDHLDPHDAAAVVAALCEDLVAADPGVAIMDRAQSVLDRPGDLREPDVVSETLLVVVALFKL